jgi:hypothetical protein
MMNSKGLFRLQHFDERELLRHDAYGRWKGSGYATKGYNDVTKLDTQKTTQIAADKGSSLPRHAPSNQENIPLSSNPLPELYSLRTFSSDSMHARQMKEEVFLASPEEKRSLVKSLLTNV